MGVRRKQRWRREEVVLKVERSLVGYEQIGRKEKGNKGSKKGRKEKGYKGSKKGRKEKGNKGKVEREAEGG